MSAKTVFVIAQALFIQSALSQFIGYNGLAPLGVGAPAMGLGYNGRLGYNGLGYNGLAYDGIGCGCGYAQALDFTPTSGGGLPVASASAFAPVGISVASDNIYEGALAVAGELPFVGTVAFENVLPTAGAGVVNHACGNGINAMANNGAAYGAAIPAIAPIGLAAPFASPAYGYNAGCGCGGVGYVI